MRWGDGLRNASGRLEVPVTGTKKVVRQIRPRNSRYWCEGATALKLQAVVPGKTSKLQFERDRTANRHRWTG